MTYQIKEKAKITSPEKAVDIFRSFLNMEDKIDKMKEHFWVLHLNAQNRPIAAELVSLGILNAAMVHPREVFTRAIAMHSASIIVSHNHPSGEVTPSREDITLTKRLIKAGQLLGIEVIDHLIITEDKHFSFKEKGLIDKTLI